jgi:hypothetical protein
MGKTKKSPKYRKDKEAEDLKKAGKSIKEKK